MKKLTNEQMINVEGGDPVTLEEYCATARMILENNPDQQGTEGALVAGGICSDEWS